MATRINDIELFSGKRRVGGLSIAAISRTAWLDEHDPDVESRPLCILSLSSSMEGGCLREADTRKLWMQLGEVLGMSIKNDVIGKLSHEWKPLSRICEETGHSQQQVLSVFYAPCNREFFAKRSGENGTEFALPGTAGADAADPTRRGPRRRTDSDNGNGSSNGVHKVTENPVMVDLSALRANHQRAIEAIDVVMEMCK